MAQRLALGLSGGGDSVALLHALRAAYPEAELHALIVDHGLRAESAGEAQIASDWARAIGATPHILQWTRPRTGQGHARLARHTLLAEACHELDIQLLCLGHTLDDRIETLRMRADRFEQSGEGEASLAGPSLFDPSPVWPEGRGLTLARPFLGVRRAQLRRYLKQLRQDWIEDPSNDDPRYERVRVRQNAWLEDGPEELDLLARSDAALTARNRLIAEAYTLVEAGAELLDWGGMRLDRDVMLKADPEVLALALDALLLAVSGSATPPTPKILAQIVDALRNRSASTAAGAALTPGAILGRDPGGVTGRADGAEGHSPLDLAAGESGVFDRRFFVKAHGAVMIEAWGEDSRLAGAVPVALRPGLLSVRDPATGQLLALQGVNRSHWFEIEQLAAQRIASRLLPPPVPTWFDAKECARKVELTLAK